MKKAAVPAPARTTAAAAHMMIILTVLFSPALDAVPFEEVPVVPAEEELLLPDEEKPGREDSLPIS